MRMRNSRIHQFFFPSFTYKTSTPDIHLTFDDGPHPLSTRIILNVLKSKNAKATFFLVGKNVQTYPAITRQILAEGHVIGNHSFDHPVMILRSKRFVVDQLSRTENAIAAATSMKPRLFRPPYGFLDQWTAKIARQMGYEIVMWTTDPADFQRVAASDIVKRATSSAAGGSIILMHDNDATFDRIGEILTKVLDHLSQRGFAFSALPS